MNFISSSPQYDSDFASKKIWQKLETLLKQVDGICYYKYPILQSATSFIPDITLLAEGFQPLILKRLLFSIDDLEEVDEYIWTVKGEKIPSPIEELESYLVALKFKFDRNKYLRGKYTGTRILALPLISRNDFEDKFDTALADSVQIWNDFDVSGCLEKMDLSLDEQRWRLAKSIFQGAAPLREISLLEVHSSDKISEAIAILDKDIALLDEDQHKVAVQIAPGPQLIRGLAGTGKTVVLT